MTWSSRSSKHMNKHSHKITWLELLVDFEFTSGCLCMRDAASTLNCGKRVVLLKHIVKTMLTIRSEGVNSLKAFYGEDKNVSALASFGCLHADGIQRRPRFLRGCCNDKTACEKRLGVGSLRF